jgi:hypothetical protein
MDLRVSIDKYRANQLIETDRRSALDFVTTFDSNVVVFARPTKAQMKYGSPASLFKLVDMWDNPSTEKAAATITTIVPTTSVTTTIAGTNDDIKSTEDPIICIAAKPPSCIVSTITDSTVFIIEPAPESTLTLMHMGVKQEFTPWFNGATINHEIMLLDFAQHAYGVKLNEFQRVIAIENFYNDTSIETFCKKAVKDWGLPTIVLDHVAYLYGHALGKVSPYVILLEILFGVFKMVGFQACICDDVKGTLNLALSVNEKPSAFQWTSFHTSTFRHFVTNVLRDPSELAHRNKALMRRDSRLICLWQFMMP